MRRSPLHRAPDALLRLLPLLLITLASAPLQAQQPDEEEAIEEGGEVVWEGGEEVVEGEEVVDDGEEVSQEEARVEPPEDTAFPVGTVETTALANRGAMSGAAQRVEQIDPDLLERRGATNLAQALEWLSAGSSVSPSGTTQGIVIDGLPTSQVVVLRDGLPITRPAGSQQGPLIDLSAVALIPESIERIDIYRGSGPVGSGSAGGVIIDIITRRPEPGTLLFARSQTSSQPGEVWWLAQDLTGGAQWSATRQLALEAFGTYHQSEAVDVDGDGRPDTAQRRRGGGELSWSWRPNTNDFLRLKVIGNTSRTESLGGERDVFDDLVARDLIRLRAQGRWWLGEDLRLDHNLDLGVENNTFRKRVRSSGFERLKADTYQENVQQVVTLTWFMKRHDLAGETYARGWRIGRTGETGELPQVAQGELGVGLADTFYAHERLELFARGVAERSSAYGSGVNGQGSASWKAVPKHWVLRATASSTRRVPTPEELYLSFDHSEVGYRLEGNPNLGPERLNSVQLSSVLSDEHKRLGLEAQAFYHRINDVVVTRTVPGESALFTYANGGQAHTAGGQVTGQLARLFWNVDLIGNYTFLPLAKERDTGADLPQRARHAGRAEVRRKFLDQKLELWTDVSARSAMSVPAGAAPAPGNVVWGAGGRYSPSDGFTLTLDVNNLLDQRNATWGPTPGRYLFVSLEVRERRAPR